jgi:thiosulfate reductase cytochrome b subunit
VRVTHWLSVVATFAMAGSGLQIWMAFPYAGPRGALYGWFPFQGLTPPSFLRLGHWLGGARHVHFAFAWLLLGAGIVYAAYLLFTGEWRRRLSLPRRDAANALDTALGYARVAPTPPRTGLYNGLQRAAYTVALALGVVEILSGLAIWKPVHLWWLAALFGGFDGARAAHFLGLVGLFVFVLGHLAMVALHPRTFVTMITGGPREQHEDVS